MILKLSDSVDADLGKLLAMAIELLEALATDLLEYEHLVSLRLVIENGGLHDGTLNVRITELDLPFGVNQQDFVEFNGLILRCREAVHEDLVTGFNLELLACNVNNCVHKNKTYFKFQPEASAHCADLLEPPGHKMDCKDSNFQ